jgi:hypothetical protein
MALPTREVADAVLPMDGPPEPLPEAGRRRDRVRASQPSRSFCELTVERCREAVAQVDAEFGA